MKCHILYEWGPNNQFVQETKSNQAPIHRIKPPSDMDLRENCLSHMSSILLKKDIQELLCFKR